METDNTLDKICSECNMFACTCMPNCGFSYNNLPVSGHTVQLSFQNNELSSNDNSRQAEQVSLLTCTSEHNNNEGSVIDLQLSKKGMNIRFLNVQGICSREMTKFAEIELMMTAEENKNLSFLSLCETKLNDNKPTNAFQVNGYHLPFRNLIILMVVEAFLFM